MTASSNKDNRNPPVRLGNTGSNRLTATEMNGGVKCQIILELDDTGRYREINYTYPDQAMKRFLRSERI